MWQLIFMIPFAWISIFLIHEVCHCCEGLRQGGNNAYIRMWTFHGIPSMRANCLSFANRDLFNLAGGLYSGIISLTIGTVGWLSQIEWIEMPFVSLGVLNLIYSIYEWRYLGEWSNSKYMILHYFLYIAVLVPLAIWYIVR